MNSPNPVNTNPGPAAPTIGALLGGVAAGAVVHAIGGSAASDPVIATSIYSGVSAILAGLFHWIGQKTGNPGW